MGRIRILTDAVASQVAAGEVVERPASIVKELAENSLDAGATRIEIEFSRGGMEFLRVSDDGCGMDREDALLCLERHATSKLLSINDLHVIKTMGFRGEALPSIASVSRFRLVTREPGSVAGTEVIVAGGKIESVAEIGAPIGTTIEVRSLFYNVPARRKFLRGEQTESAHILQALQGVALAHPAIAFEILRERRVLFQLPPAASLDVRVRDLLGADFLARLVAIEPYEGEGVRVNGLLAKPGEGRKDRLQQFVFLNGRPVSCPAVSQPLREAYAETLPRGSQPLAVLHVEMDPRMVDCNVHPAKREVRLHRPEALSQSIFDVARKALQSARSAWTQQLEAPVARRSSFVPAPRQEMLRPTTPSDRPPPATRPEVAPSPAPGKPAFEPALPFRLLGFLGEYYLVFEGDEGMVVLDARAAGERILFENLLRQMAEGDAPSQRLLMPVIAELPGREHAWVCEHLEELRRAGILLEPFGGNTVKIEGLPPFANGKEAKDFLHEIAFALRASGKVVPGRAAHENLARTVCQLAAYEKPAGNPDRARRLIENLLRCELPYASPNGRPTMIQFSFSELGRKFGLA